MHAVVFFSLQVPDPVSGLFDFDRAVRRRPFSKSIGRISQAENVRMFDALDGTIVADALQTCKPQVYRGKVRADQAAMEAYRRSGGAPGGKEPSLR